MAGICTERNGLTVSIHRNGLVLRSTLCRSLQAAVSLEAKLTADANFALWWATANEDPRPTAAHPHERPFSSAPTPALLRTKSRRQISVTTDDALLIVTDGERTRRKACSTGLAARNLASRYTNSPELAERWLYAELRDAKEPSRA